MKKKLLSALLSTAMVATLLVGCSGQSAQTAAPAPEAAEETTEAAPETEETEEAAPAAEANGKTVGVAMPTQSSERWINDGADMKEQLEALGYAVDLQYAEDDVQAQVSQIENLIAKNVSCLVIAAVDSSALVNVEAQAKEAGIPIIAYDRLLMDTDAVSYYATFDNKGVGTAIAKYVEDKMSLATAEADGKSYTVELFMGSPDDNNAVFLYNGVMEVLQPYFDNGVLVCESGQTDFESNNTLRWSQETAQQRCENILTANYADKKLDIAITAYDGLSYGVRSALEGAGYKVGEDWPLITGQDAETMACKNILSGHQTMSICKDTSLLASKCVTMVQAVLEGTEPEINDTEQYNNNVITVPSYLCTPVPVDADNLKEVIVDGGIHSAADIGL
ncbi:MAG: sugar ABC transporter substrate-binding protein [Clostridia bacterium]|nr:sugar ABC transporter substrate-binding protein [Clostridia bacterium]